MLEFLDIEQRIEVYHVIKATLPALIKNGKDLGNVLRELKGEQRAEVCNAMKETLPSLIKNVYELREMLHWLSVKQCSEVCNTMKETLPSLIKNVHDLREVLGWLGLEQCGEICRAIKEKLPVLIKNSKDLARFKKIGINESALNDYLELFTENSFVKLNATLKEKEEDSIKFFLPQFDNKKNNGETNKEINTNNLW